MRIESGMENKLTFLFGAEELDYVIRNTVLLEIDTVLHVLYTYVIGFVILYTSGLDLGILI